MPTKTQPQQELVHTKKKRGLIENLYLFVTKTVDLGVEALETAESGVQIARVHTEGSLEKSKIKVAGEIVGEIKELEKEYGDLEELKQTYASRIQF